MTKSDFQAFANDTIKKLNSTERLKYYACKVVERKNLCQYKESLIVSEISNQDSISSNFVVKMCKAIKTDARYYIFMEYCNGGDLKQLMQWKQYKITPQLI